MLTLEDFAKWIRPCPDNGVSHDCTQEYVMWMPVEALDELLMAAEYAERSARLRNPTPELRQRIREITQK